MSNQPLKQSGMTLLEVMVALSIFSIAAIAVMQSLSQQVKNLPYVEESMIANWAANNRMVEESFLAPHQPGTKTGEFEKEMLGRQLFWKTEVKDASDQMRLIFVSVSDDSDFKRAMAELQYYEAR